MKGPESAASAAAERLVRDRGLTTLPVSPIDLAAFDGISVSGADLDGASGVLVCSGGAFGILFSRTIGNEAFQRFSVAHELGHYHLPGHPEALFTDGDVHRSHAGFESATSYEIEADHFAAGLLMPLHLFKAALSRGGDGLDAIQAAATACATSLTATAIRYAQCTEEPVAVIVSSARSMDYCFMSDELRDVPGLTWIRKGESLPRDSCTYRFNSSADRVRRADRDEGTSDLSLWFGGRREREVLEQVVGLGSYGKTLTVLSGCSAFDDEDDEGDEALEESWTPRFRR
jgi:IrrE N-terminal-like domain